ncbi:A disintegrin and metalloproteinase with thrombospondin motifs 18 [Portunus trituberculatus]|uniref:A disintegrin and metalloproteinase with thrombospondin motifs 18 n=1 Tax=Portunus trituberculatus TaxID=210409 RepID=A0A5B7EGS1_PORTR|nr:A disintegrin and metalloproteinase with thrombospondin motifs 18 [Portunus trituberculatus]
MTRAVRRRVTRKSSKKYTMELAVYIDDSLISHVQKRYPKANPKNKAKEIVMTLLNVGKQWDHALLLTGLDLYSGEPQATSTTGMSFIGGMCSPKHSCSIVEGTKFTSAFTIAHEIGHNMNLVHDGEKRAASCSKKGHIMATSLNDGGHTWSSCSKNQLSDFLRNQGTCLAEESGGAMLTYPIPDEELPGRKFDADQQCHYMFGKGWSHAPDHHPVSVSS